MLQMGRSAQRMAEHSTAPRGKSRQEARTIHRIVSYWPLLRNPHVVPLFAIITVFSGRPTGLDPASSATLAYAPPAKKGQLLTMATNRPSPDRRANSTTPRLDEPGRRIIRVIVRRLATAGNSSLDPSLSYEPDPSYGYELRRNRRRIVYSRRVFPTLPSMDHLLSASPDVSRRLPVSRFATSKGFV